MSMPLKVFEHEYLEIDGEKFQRHHWKALARFNTKNGNKYFTLYPDGIKFNQYVGAIQAGNLTIEILPKADKEDKDLSKWHRVLVKMLNECRFIKVDHPELAHLQIQSNFILDAYLSLFLQEIEKLLHGGLIKKYRRAEGNLSSLKGKLLFHQQLNKNLVHQERFYVQYSTYDKEHLIHQILYKALKLVSMIATNGIIRGKANRLLLDFPEMKNIRINEATFKRIVKDRKTASYRPSLLISRMLLLNCRPDITGGNDHVLAMLFDMNKLWEEYVYRQLVKLDQNWSISRQNSIDFWEPIGGEAKSLRPDLIIEDHPKGKIVIDTKWKLVDDIYPADDDLQQMFAYAHYVQSNYLVLLYPSKNKKKPEGRYVLDHSVRSNVKEKVRCVLLKIPLKWEGDEFAGLDLSLEDF